MARKTKVSNGVRTNKHKASNKQTSDATSSGQVLNPTKRSAFSGWSMIICWLAMLIFTFHACTHMVAAGDTWVAMACGRHFVNHGVDTVEPFSANSHKAGPTEEEIKTWPNWAQWIANKVGIETVKYWHPTGWVNQNWLTHVIFYSLIPKSSYADGVSFPSNALVYWKFAIYIITMICVYYTGRLMGVNPALCAVFSCFSLFIGRSFLDIRPAGFSNMLVAVFLLILVLTTYRNVLYIWLIVPVTVFWCNVHGGYIYAFIMLFPFVGLLLPTSIPNKKTLAFWVTGYLVVVACLARIIHISWSLIFLMIFAYIVFSAILWCFKEGLVSVSQKGISHIVIAAFVTFIAVVLFNPFHLTNLTHTFVISVSEHAARWREIHEWRPAFDWDNPVGTAVPFLVMYIIAWLALLAWVFVMIISRNSVNKGRKRKEKIAGEYQWPKIDLPLIIIAVLTVYMAIRSRRFIPIAGIAACPVIAMFIDQLICAMSAASNYRKKNRLTVSAMPDYLRLSVICVGVFAISFFGVWWGLKFKSIYLDPWPRDPKLTSVFMRMTDSGQKPFYACKFIKDNKLKGKMFNYWTEGGFIAFGQEPDPNTGRTPLKLFMDGRAQAAYNRDAFDRWSYIMSGGPLTAQLVARARVRGRQSLSASDYKEIGKWMNEQLREENVWVVLMPHNTYSPPPPEEYYVKTSYHAVLGLERNPNWPLVFFNNKQKLFVDIGTPQGKALYDGIFNGSNIYPDEYHKNLISAHSWLFYRFGIKEKQKGFDFAVRAFNLNPSPAPMREIIFIASQFAEIRPQVEKFCEDYVKDFVENESVWMQRNGYRNRVEAAQRACLYLGNIARKMKNTELANFYDTQATKCVGELLRVARDKRW
ncbi:MAG: hypothetical protein PVH77_06545 [Phycisphaerales bacterium]|jgi:hypothetical protein